MGDKGNILVRRDFRDSGVYLYTHFGGSSLLCFVQNALLRNKESWNYSWHIAALIFGEMREEGAAMDGFGISSAPVDTRADRPIVVVDCSAQTVSLMDDPRCPSLALEQKTDCTMSFDSFVKSKLPTSEGRGDVANWMSSIWSAYNDE